MKKLSAAFIGLGAVLVVGLFLLSALVTMLLVNVVLHHYHAQTLDYGSALAVTGLLSLVGGGSRAGSNNGKS